MTLNILPIALLLAGTLFASSHGFAQETTLPQAERLATGLKQGMSSEAVRKLLGAPTRTALRTEGNSSNDVKSGNLQWTYTWADARGPGTLRIEFGTRVPETWSVTRWEWVR